MKISITFATRFCEKIYIRFYCLSPKCRNQIACIHETLNCWLDTRGKGIHVNQFLEGTLICYQNNICIPYFTRKKVSKTLKIIYLIGVHIIDWNYDRRIRYISQLILLWHHIKKNIFLQSLNVSFTSYNQYLQINLLKS